MYAAFGQPRVDRWKSYAYEVAVWPKLFLLLGARSLRRRRVDLLLLVLQLGRF